MRGVLHAARDCWQASCAPRGRPAARRRGGGRHDVGRTPERGRSAIRLSRGQRRRDRCRGHLSSLADTGRPMAASLPRPPCSGRHRHLSRPLFVRNQCAGSRALALALIPGLGSLHPARALPYSGCDRSCTGGFMYHAAAPPIVPQRGLRREGYCPSPFAPQAASSFCAVPAPLRFGASRMDLKVAFPRFPARFRSLRRRSSPSPPTSRTQLCGQRRPTGIGRHRPSVAKGLVTQSTRAMHPDPHNRVRHSRSALGGGASPSGA